MKKTFRGYYRPTDAEFDALWNSARFSFDANVLLRIYGYSEPTRDALLATLLAIKDRVWMPHQYAAEYQRNRAEAILGQVQQYEETLTQLARIENTLESRTSQPFIERRSLLQLQRIKREIQAGQERYRELLKEDPILERLTELFEGRVGSAPSTDDVTKMSDDGRTRYKSNTPPGYKDSAKPEPHCYGDYFGWAQILQYGDTEKCAMILVTNDAKEDWWFFARGQRLGPRPELVEEYIARSGKEFYMYSVESFLERAPKYLNQPVAPSALQEIRERGEADKKGDVKIEPPSGDIKISPPNPPTDLKIE